MEGRVLGRTNRQGSNYDLLFLETSTENQSLSLSLWKECIMNNYEWEYDWHPNLQWILKQQLLIFHGDSQTYR